MRREFIMIFVIIALVVTGNVITQKYTSDFFEELENDLNRVKEHIIEIKKESSSNKTSNSEVLEKFIPIRTKWNNKYNKLAYYSEHDELEKIGVQLAIINGYLENEEYELSSAEIDKTVFLLEHIKNKDNFKLVNIF
jgi:hypothetical protein